MSLSSWATKKESLDQVAWTVIYSMTCFVSFIKPFLIQSNWSKPVPMHHPVYCRIANNMGCRCVASATAFRCHVISVCFIHSIRTSHFLVSTWLSLTQLETSTTTGTFFVSFHLGTSITTCAFFMHSYLCNPARDFNLHLFLVVLTCVSQHVTLTWTFFLSFCWRSFVSWLSLLRPTRLCMNAFSLFMTLPRDFLSSGLC